MRLISTNMGPSPTGEVVFSSPPPHVCNKNRLCWNLTPNQFHQMTGVLIAKTRKVYDAVGSLELDSVTFDNTLKALANMQAEYTVEKNILIFPLEVAPSQSETRTASQNAFKELIEFEEDMSMRKDVYQRIVALGMKVDEDSLTTEEKRYMQRLLGEGIKEIQDKMKRVEVDAHRLTTEAYIDTYMETNMEARRRALHLPKQKQNEIKCINNKVSRINVDNVSLERLVQLRAQKSALLGFKTYADFALQTSMAKSANTVSMFLEELAHKLKPNTIPDLSTREILPVQLREYFPVDIVTQGLLDICQDLLGLSFNLVHGAPVWHPDVTLYSVTDSSSGQIMGQFYLDLFKREGKDCSPFTYPLQPSCLLPDGSRQIAVAACVTNFPRSSTDSYPYLLQHYDVMNYFHEFGHVMHILCAQTDYAIFSPCMDWYSDYNWYCDFSEVPSQMLENWVWEKDPLQRISKHYKTGAPIPDELLDKLIKSRLTVHTMVNKRCTTSQNIFLAKLEQALHTQTGLVDPLEVYERLRTEILRDPGYKTADIPTYNTIQFTMTLHYYRYLWGEVFSMDMFHTRFKQEGIMNPKVGLDYRNCILKPGYSEDPYEMLKNFLGREPNKEAFLLSKKSAFNVEWDVVEEAAFVQEPDTDEEWDYAEF